METKTETKKGVGWGKNGTGGGAAESQHNPNCQGLQTHGNGKAPRDGKHLL